MRALYGYSAIQKHSEAHAILMCDPLGTGLTYAL